MIDDPTDRLEVGVSQTRRLKDQINVRNDFSCIAMC